MEPYENGGAAFPTRHEPEMEVGMSLRDYFAAHAPHQPHSWFNPVMRSCPLVPSIQNIEDAATRVDVVMAEEGGTDPETEAGAAWIKARNHLAQEQEAWQHEFRVQRHLQWPYAWADAMLKQRTC